MAKRINFELALNTSFRWPMQSDKPFSEASEPAGNAKIAGDGFTRLVLMVDGYKKAADLMVERTIEDWRERDLLVFPIIFNYRHFLELSLKYHLATYGRGVEIAPNWNSHDLVVLWSEFRDMLDRYGIDDPDEVDPVVESIILSYAKVDPGSFSHRYPVDRQGITLPVARSELDLENLADVMNAVANYFKGTDGYLSALASA
jgi:hypothetical protein